MAEPPRGWQRVGWLGPGIIWMLSAAASGELLLTPRIGSLYGYTLLWALVGALALKWVINREIGRYAVVTGRGVLEGFAQVPGPLWAKGWAVWLLLVPQLVVASATIAGLAASAGTALILFLPGGTLLWMIVTTVSATAVVLWGRYAGVERICTVIAVVLGVSALIAAAVTFSDGGGFVAGLAPTMPADVDYGELLPWLGFASAGAAGLVWYSYWIKAKGYGLARGAGEFGEPDERIAEDERRLRGWITQMTWDNSVAVGGTAIITIAFLILGVELLRPEGLVPEQDQVAETLGRLLEGPFGRLGFWFMIVAVFVGFWDTVLSDDDGFMRSFANGTRIVTGGRGTFGDEARLARLYLVVLLTVLPVLLYLVVGEPVGLLQIAGGIEAIQIPLVAFLMLFINRRLLPQRLRPNLVATAFTAFAGLFFLVFAGIFVVQTLAGD